MNETNDITKQEGKNSIWIGRLSIDFIDLWEKGSTGEKLEKWYSEFDSHRQLQKLS